MPLLTCALLYGSNTVPNDKTSFDLRLSSGRTSCKEKGPPLAVVVFSRCGHPVHAQCLVGLERDEEGPFFSAAKTLGSQGSS